MNEVSTSQIDRPVGKAKVKSALQKAALTLLAERGMSFSIREVAKLARVNHGLVHRHFGSKEALLKVAIAERNEALRLQVQGNSSPMDLTVQGGPATAAILARLILEDATSLIGDHIATKAIVERAALQVVDTDPLTAAHRTALANAIVLGWTVFGEYALQAAGTTRSQEVESALRSMVDSLLNGQAIESIS
ncbi:MAG: helix-turn-helix domain-containing protein [Pseudomonadota bacterium]|jgi:AcrR family transcriptional regulator|nr:helix-turn-helix domain-containing protein [Pseudomonadota bacterium]MEC8820491.1 helix-turn-helix domain-containing protein [Pseudomonadota bacterium]